MMLNGNTDSPDDIKRNFSIDDQDLLRYICEEDNTFKKLVLPKAMCKDVLAFTHVYHDHPGIAVTTHLMQRKFHWKTLIKDARDYV